MSTLCLRDILDVRAHPTVVRLENLDSPDARWISESYWKTPDAERHVEALMRALSGKTGLGAFLIGAYGSGKSHFLAYVARALASGAFVPDGPTPIAISLLNFQAGARLEEIVGTAAGVRPVEGSDDRRSAWSERLRRDPRGIVLLLDELSEFLKSKPDRASLAEDIRYLQFLGEWAGGARLWVIAAVQEQVEHMGILDHAQYRKIKDRYPLRLILTPSHVKDIIAYSILVKKPGYEAGVERLAARIRDALPASLQESVDLGLLERLYPIHPRTIDLLDQVRDSFSQARGAVHFAVTQLQGDPVRGVPPFLDMPVGAFVTPDAIVDHFRDLFDIQPEFQPIAQRLLPYYEEHAAKLFDTEAQRELGLKIVKLLALCHLSPGGTAPHGGLTASEAAVALLLTPSRLDPDKNVAIAHRVLRTLVERGRYVKQDRDRFVIDLADDSAASLERLLARESSDLEQAPDLVFATILPLFSEGGEDAPTPLGLPLDQWQSRAMRWCHHERNYAVYLGNGTPPAREGIGLAIRLPWGGAEPAAGISTLLPEPIGAGADVVELAALLRLRRKSVGTDVQKRIVERIDKRSRLLQAMVVTAYARGTFVRPSGEREAASAIGASGPLHAFLDRHAEWMLRLVYPGFERYAPSAGPLPHDAYRVLMRFLAAHDLAEADAPDPVKLVREAYLVRMDLLERRGREYVVPKAIEKNELVRAVMTVLPEEPVPRTLYEHLAGPTFGLVPDQIHLLLVMLHVLGEIDIVKERRSYRDVFETFPTPLTYDRIVPGRALPLEHLRALQDLCEGLSVKVPKQWTVLAARRAVREVSEVLRGHAGKLHPLALKIDQSGQGAGLASRVRRVLADIALLDRAPGEIAALQLFLSETGTPRGFLGRLREVAAWPERVERTLSERSRLEHLLAHPAFGATRDPGILDRLAELGRAPELDQSDELDRWMERARSLYESYRTSYTEAHERYWQAIASTPVLAYAPSPIARSRHLGLGSVLSELQTLHERFHAARCRRIASLDFQPACTCGFDGSGSPMDAAIEQLARVRERLERDVASFFAQKDVRDRVASWQAGGIETTPGTLAYLDRKAPIPDIQNVELLDRHLSGVLVVKDVDPSVLVDAVAGKSWDRPGLLAALGDLVRGLGSERVRFSTPASQVQRAPDPILDFCLEQCLRHGVPFPAGFTPEELQGASRHVRPDWIQPASLQRIESLALPEPVIDEAIRALLQGRVPWPAAPSPLVEAAREIALPTAPGTPAELAAQGDRLYRQHRRLHRIEPARWRERLEALATAEIPGPLPDLASVLEQGHDASWLLLDACGLPMLGALRSALPTLLPDFRIASEAFATVSTTTTTDACYSAMAARGINHAFRKIDAIDHLLHERFLDFDDLCRVAIAELHAAIRPLRGGFDGTRPLLVFADHGFRIAPDGKSYRHGGPTTLERVVPILTLRRT